MAKEDAILDGDGREFDPIEFANGVFTVLEKFRSNVAPIYDALITTPSVGINVDGGEHRLNTFYRLLGLPATRDETFLTALDVPVGFSAEQARLFQTLKISQDGTLNYVKSAGVSFIDIKARNSLANRKVEAPDYQTMLSSPLSPDASLSGGGGRRVRILPMVVDAAIPIFPLSRRSAPLFHNGHFVYPGKQTRLTRSFLEHVVYMRTKAFSGKDSNLVEQIRQNIINSTNDSNLAKLPGEFTLLNSIIVNKFLQALRQSATRYNQVIQKAFRLQSEVVFSLRPSANPNQRSIISLSDDPNIEITTKLGVQIQELNKKLAEQEAFLSTLPTEDVSRRDRIRNIEDGIVLNNVSDDVFVSEFSKIVSFEREQIEAQLAEVREEEKRKIRELEQLKRDIIFYSGEFNGLSIFDVLCVFYALFTIEISSLIGLLNEDAKTRLKSDPFFSTNQGDTAAGTNDNSLLGGATVSASEAISALEKQTTVAFNLAQNFFLSSIKAVQ